MTLYQGDDFVNLMNVYIHGEGGDLPEIEKAVIKIGPLEKVYDHPNNPFTVDVMREESIKLSTLNKVRAAVWYHALVDGVDTILKKTCEGTYTINTNPEVVGDGRCKC